MAAVSLSNANAGAPVAAKNPAPVEVDWKAHTIAPVTNPIFFEDPVIRSEIRPISSITRWTTTSSPVVVMPRSTRCRSAMR